MVDKALQWTRDDSGNLTPPARQSEFMDWLLDDDREPKTELQWAATHKIPLGTVKKWKQDARFKEQWERRAAEKNINPERIQKVIDVLYSSAVKTGDISAAQKFLAYAEKLMPPREVRRDNSVAHLSDDELVAEIRALVADGLG